ncbi:hypothetical protein AVEN_221086-1 [Araneus ventricosus]|uniref:Uncharacterized protein n=1 Tax=Araneus ventricosus TaxID=182803 RepID=A0A4Y2SGI1_ARAVE|nr:hypothetical protein AVEN_221086-1 [Araneus ventricosus]
MASLVRSFSAGVPIRALFNNVNCAFGAAIVSKRNKTKAWYPDAEFFEQFEGPVMYPQYFPPETKWRPKRYKDDSLNLEDSDDLEESCEILVEKKTDLKKLDEGIHKLIDTESVEADVVTFEEYQEKCSRFIKRINRVLRKEKTSNKKLDESRVKPQNSVKLPKLVLEKYSGDPKKITEFWNSYESTIDKNESLNKVKKFAYLKTLLIGAASNVVASLELNEKNYDECIKTLKERFGKKDIIVSQFMNKLLNLESVKSASNVKALLRLYDEIEIAVRNLEAQGVTKGSFGQLLIPVLLKSIPEEFVLEFNRKKKSKDEICVSDLLDFLKNEIECRESTYLLCQEKKVTLPPRFEHAKFDNKKFSRNVPTAASFNAVDSRTCIFCDKYQNSFLVIKVLAKNCVDCVMTTAAMCVSRNFMLVEIAGIKVIVRNAV